MYIIYTVYGFFLTINKRTKHVSRFFVRSFSILNVLTQMTTEAQELFLTRVGEVKISVLALTYTFLKVNNL